MLARTKQFQCTQHEQLQQERDGDPQRERMGHGRHDLRALSAGPGQEPLGSFAGTSYFASALLHCREAAGQLTKVLALKSNLSLPNRRIASPHTEERLRSG